MLFDNRLVRLVIYAALGVLWLAGCGQTPTSAEIATATIVEGTQALPPTSEPSTVTPTASGTGMPSPAPPTSTATPPAPQPTASPAPPPQEPYYEDLTGPASLLASYYNAINRQEYSRAWGYWETPPNPSFEEFVAGFVDTESVMPVVRPPTWFEGAAGSKYASVPALLSATHVDGSRHNFVGCFAIRRSNVGEAGVEQEWSLFDATVRFTPGNSADALLLTQVCESVPKTRYEDRTGPVRLLASYYNAINLGEYSRAWEYWERPPGPSFEEFAAGFADTESVMLVVRPPTRSEGAAGSAYVTIPALLSATHTDGSRHNFMGCFVTRRSNIDGLGGEQTWSLFNATVQRTPDNTTDVTLLEQACVTKRVDGVEARPVGMCPFSPVGKRYGGMQRGKDLPMARRREALGGSRKKLHPNLVVAEMLMEEKVAERLRQAEIYRLLRQTKAKRSSWLSRQGGSFDLSWEVR